MYIRNLKNLNKERGKKGDFYNLNVINISWTETHNFKSS